jgi:hypothetical protein
VHAQLFKDGQYCAAVIFPINDGSIKCGCGCTLVGESLSIDVVCMVKVGCTVIGQLPPRL